MHKTDTEMIYKCKRAAGLAAQFRLTPRESSHPSSGQTSFFFPGLEKVCSEMQEGGIRTQKANVTSTQSSRYPAH